MPQKSYFAKSNKGKALHVFLNNWADNSKKEHKKRLLEQEIADRVSQRIKEAEYKSAVRLNEMQEKQAIRAAEKEARQAAKAKQLADRDQKKYASLEARVRIVCEKHKIDEICCDEVIQEAIDADVPASSVEKTLIEGRVDKWIARADAMHEERSRLLIETVIDVVLKNKGVHPDYMDACREEVEKSSPDINEIENSPIFDKYVALSKAKQAEDEYPKKAEFMCKKIVDSHLIFPEFSNDLLEEILDTRPPLEHFSKSDVLAKYIKMTADKKSEVNARLAKYLSGNLYE